MSRHVREKKAVFSGIALLILGAVAFGSSAVKRVDARMLWPGSAPGGGWERREPVSAAPDVRYAPGGSPLLPAAEGDTETLPVLLYHGITDRADRFTITSETFREQLFALRREGFRAISLDEYLAWRDGAPLPARSFLLTFDDGRRDSYVQADPVLKATGYRAVMFVATVPSLHGPGKRHNDYYLRREDLAAMVASGRWEIGSHAMQASGGQIPVDADGSQANFLSNLRWERTEGRRETGDAYRERVRRELAGSRDRIAETLGVAPKAFSYPYGDFGQQTVNNPEAAEYIAKVVDYRYALAFRQVWDADAMFKTNLRDGNPSLQKRIEVPTDWSGDRLVTELGRVIHKPLPFVDAFTADEGWRSTWGSAAVSDGRLAIGATERTTGGDAFLEGSAAWKDYAATVEYDWVAGDRLTLMARYRDAEHYSQCVFGGGRVRIDAVDGGDRTVLAEMPSAIPVHDPGGTVGVRVAGGVMECLVDGRLQVSAAVPDGRGGLSIKMWAEEPGVAKAEVRRVTVVRED